MRRITKEADKARASEQAELGKLSSELARNIQALSRQRQQLQSGEQTELASALRADQQEHVRAHLSRARVNSAKIPGIGPGVVSSLAACGICNAADFSGIQHVTGPRGGQQVYIRRANGTLVHPNGVGEKKARDLEAWRQAVEHQAIASQPRRLPADKVSVISSRYIQQRRVLDDQQKEAETQNASQQAEVARKWAPTHAAIATKLTARRQEAAANRVQLDGEIAEARKQASTVAWQRDLAERQLAAYRNVSYLHYLAGIIGS